MPNESVILIADDERHNLELLISILKAGPYRFETAVNGVEALSKARATNPDLLLLDVMMPKMNGFEVCHQICQDADLNQMPIIMVTALDDRDARRKAIEVGADDLLQKPVDRHEVRMRVQSITRLQRYRSYQAEHRKFELIADLAPDGYVVVNDLGVITYANRQARHLMGMSDAAPMEVRFVDQLKLQFQPDPEFQGLDWSQVLKSSRENPFLMVFPETDHALASWIQLEVIAQPSTHLTGTLVRMSNVTTQLTLQRDLWKFHSQISHKLRTPLVGLVGALDLLEMDDLIAQRSDTRELVEMGRAGLSRLQNGVEEILRYLDTPRLVRQERSMKVDDVPLVIHKAASDVGVSPVQIQLSSESSSATLRIPPMALELTLVELFRNARKFHPRKQPRVRVTIQRMAGTSGFLLRVEDDGVHLSPDRLAKVWLPYYQTEKNQTGEMDGMGLGLAMIASIVRECGGVYRMFNRPDHPGVAVELQIPTLTDK